MNCKLRQVLSVFSLPVLALGLLLAAGVARAQVKAPPGGDGRSDVSLHKFQPAVRPEDALARQRQSGGLAPSVGEQMQALLQEKASRTPTQRKIDSNLLYTTRMLGNQPAAPGVPYLYTGVDLDQNNNLMVDITAYVTQPLLRQLRAAGAVVLYSNAELRSIRALVPPGQLEGIAASPDVIFIAPRQGFMTHREPAPPNSSLRLLLPSGFQDRAARVRSILPLLLQQVVIGTGQGSVTTEGDLTHRAAAARGAFGISGTGLKIGVLSDGVSSAAQSQATGDLPPNCGTPPCLTVLPGQGGSGDEGTAMLEIIHDMVPGASLYFATADFGITAFAQNIRALRAAGCDIIVDDVFYFVETPFQDGQASSIVANTNGGVVIQAVNDVVANGALYFSSAGNEGNIDDHTSGTYESDFDPVASAVPLPAGNVHSFGGPGYDTIIQDSPFGYTLHWADPLGGSKNDYDFFILDTTGTLIFGASTNIQSGTQDPYEQIGAIAATGARIVVFQHTGAANRFFHLSTLRGTLSVNTTGETHGHSAASGAYTVAATPAAGAFGPGYPAGPFPNAFNSANAVELFSSDGLRRLFFNGDGSAITPGNFSSTGGTLLNKPDITGADGVSVTGVGGFGSPFYGTSAAAPSAASVAALVKSASPSLTQAQIRNVLTSTAVDIMAPGFDRDSGAGIVMAFDAVSSLGLQGQADPELAVVTASENPGNGNGIIEAGEGAKLVIQLKNTFGVKAATGINAVLSTATPGVTVLLPNNSAYADMPAGATGGNNLSPFLFTLASDFACGQSIDFTLTVTYSGSLTRALHFSLGTGMLSLSNNLGTKPSAPTGFTTATGTQLTRIFRDGNPSVCGTPKTFPGTFTTNNHLFDSYTFTACRAMCLNVGLTSTNGIDLFESAYSPTYDPTNLGTNYAGDAGLSGSPQAFGISTTASTQYTIVVNDVSGSGTKSAYSLQIPACALNCSVNHPPIAKVHDVTVIGPATGVNASIDNGSSDPDGDPITLGQNPAGPYLPGTTNVLLTVADNKGAAAQASANVTVMLGDYSISTTNSSATITAGQPATFTFNVGTQGTFNGTVTFSCSNLPGGSSCNFVPPTLTLSSNSGSSTLTLNTTARVTTRLWRAPMEVFAVLGLVSAFAGRRRKRSLRLLALLLLLCGIAALSGCGGSTHIPVTTGTPAGSYSVIVTGTSGNTTHSSTITVNVQ
jgi:hypothetical protein